tara:strand:+ start:118 stop:711 length:594 start_codon:yes stop_codon:yes gene_type:complete
MKSNKWLKRQSKDLYVKKAKKIGFLSRAAYKLIEIDDKYKLLSKSNRILELGAAPGSWTQIIVNRNKHAQIDAFDTIEMKFKNEKINFYKIDFLQFNFLSLKNKYDLILSDLAPNTTGHKKTDHLKLSSLIEHLIYLLDVLAKKNSNMIIKIFKGSEEKFIVSLLNKNYIHVEYFKPKSSRKDSSEIYIVARDYFDN